MNRKTTWLGILAIGAVLACVGLCAAIGIGLRYGIDIYSYLEKQSLRKVGSPAPDFSLSALGGGPVTLSQYQGQPVLLTFGASWCPDCRAEAPFQQSLHIQHPDLVMLLVDSNEQDRLVQGFADDFGMTFPVLLDSTGRVSDEYGIFGIPTTFFIDRQGIIRYVLVGALTADLAAQNLPLIGVQP